MPTDDGLRHQPTPDPTWAESWALDFFSVDAELGGVVGLTLWPNQRRSWFWASLVGADRRLVTVIDLEAPLPAEPGLELRAPGLWADLICETPFDHFTVGLEAFGVALDDPSEAFGDVRGDRTPLGLDLEWETTDVDPEADVRMACAVHGEVLVADERIEFAGHGSRSQHWGELDWAEPAFAGRRADGGAVWAPPENPVEVAWAPVAIDPPGSGPAHLYHRLVRFGSVGADDRGVGWARSAS